MTKIVSRFLKDESGATAIEYGLIAALIAVALVTAMGFLSDGLENAFKGIQGTLEGEAPPAAP